MIKKLKVRNFLSLKETSVTLGPLTVFVGPNGSGKSAVFKALTTLSRLLYSPVRGSRGEFEIEYGVGFDQAVWNGDTTLPVTFEVWLEDAESTEPDYILELGRGRGGWMVTRERLAFEGTDLDTGSGFEFPISSRRESWPGPFTGSVMFLTGAQRFARDPVAGPYLKPIQALRDRIGRTHRYRPNANDIASFVKRPAPPARWRDSDVTQTGRGLGLSLDEMWKGDRPHHDEVQKQLAGLYPHIRGLEPIEDWRGVGIGYWTHRARHLIPAPLELDGVLLATFLLWRLQRDEANLRRICLEEPEAGVQLWDLRRRYQLLRRFTEASPGRGGLQILIATHSREFLNAIESEVDILQQLRITEYSGHEGTRFFPITHYLQLPELEKELAGERRLGDLWWSGTLRPGGVHQTG